MRYTPQPYKITSLKEHLDRPDQLAKHNNLGYDHFIQFLDTPKDVRLGPTGMARAFNVSTDTIYNWMRIREREIKNGS